MRQHIGCPFAVIRSTTPTVSVTPTAALIHLITAITTPSPLGTRAGCVCTVILQGLEADDDQDGGHVVRAALEGYIPHHAVRATCTDADTGFVAVDAAGTNPRNDKAESLPLSFGVFSLRNQVIKGDGDAGTEGEIMASGVGQGVKNRPPQNLTRDGQATHDLIALLEVLFGRQHS